MNRSSFIKRIAISLASLGLTPFASVLEVKTGIDELGFRFTKDGKFNRLRAFRTPTVETTPPEDSNWNDGTKLFSCQISDGYSVWIQSIAISAEGRGAEKAEILLDKILANIRSGEFHASAKRMVAICEKHIADGNNSVQIYSALDYWNRQLKAFT